MQGFDFGFASSPGENQEIKRFEEIRGTFGEPKVPQAESRSDGAGGYREAAGGVPPNVTSALAGVRGRS